MSEDIMRDPRKKFEASIARKRYVEKKYPEIFMVDGKPQSNESFKPSLGWGVTTLASTLGARVRFDPHLDPTAIPTIKLKKVNILEDIKKPNMHDALGPIFEEIDAYVDMGFSKGEIGLPNTQGPLNIAFEAFGDKEMMSFICRKSKEEEVRHILDVASDVFIEGKTILLEELGRPVKAAWTVAGCTYFYLSPRHWTKYILPIVQKCEAAFGPSRLHHCGIANNEQIDAYSAITWEGLEFGFETDISYARKKIVNEKVGPLNISCRISPYRMLNQPKTQIEDDVDWLVEKGKGGPQRIAVVGCPYGTSDENIFALWHRVEYHNKRKEEELDEEDL